MTAQAQGLFGDVLRRADGSNYTAGGLSSRFNFLTVTGVVDASRGDDIVWKPLDEDARIFAPDDTRPEAWLYLRRVGGPVWAVIPACETREGRDLRVHLSRLMFGGNFFDCADSRFKKVTGFYGAVAIHDRVEPF